MATQIGVLDQGRLVQFGTPRDLYENPVSIYAASRLGSSRGINILPRISSPGRLPGPLSIGLRPEHIAQGEGEESFVTGWSTWATRPDCTLVFKNHDLITVTDAHTTLTHGDMVKIQPRNPLYFDASGARLA